MAGRPLLFLSQISISVAQRSPFLFNPILNCLKSDFQDDQIFISQSSCFFHPTLLRLSLSLGEKVTFFRFVAGHPSATEACVHHCPELLLRLGSGCRGAAEKTSEHLRRKRIFLAKWWIYIYIISYILYILCIYIISIYIDIDICWEEGNNHWWRWRMG